MPFVETNGIRLHYEEQGAGPETVVLAHGLLLTGAIFESQVAALKDRFRCITFDFRGHGQSDVTPDGYDLDTLTRDVVGLLDALHVRSCHVVGLSMGGMVAMRLALACPDRVRSLALIGTTAEAETPENMVRYRRLAWAARWIGLWAVAGRILPVMFGPKFLSVPGNRAIWKKRVMAQVRSGIVRAALAVISRPGFDVHPIRVPTLILVGELDAATATPCSERLHRSIEGSRLHVIPGAGHLCNIEEPEVVNTALVRFLE